MHDNSKLMFEEYARPYFRSGMRVLEIGPEAVPSTYQKIIADPSIVWHTLDLRDEPLLTYHSSSEYEFPVDSASYDIVLSGQVLEHVRRIWVWMRELARVCKKGGLVITINPVSWPYHEAPVDCWRVFPDGMRALYEDASLEVELSKWDSLEPVPGRRRLPGRSAAAQTPRRRLAYRMLSLTGFPVECAFDTITVGRKQNEASR